MKFMIDDRELKDFANTVKKIRDNNVRSMMHSIEENVLDEYVEEVKSITPVKTGKLLAGWSKSREKLKKGKYPKYISAVINNVEYAHVVENGRFDKENKKYATKGKLMMKRTDKKIRSKIDSIAKEDIKSFEDMFKK